MFENQFFLKNERKLSQTFQEVFSFRLNYFEQLLPKL